MRSRIAVLLRERGMSAYRLSRDSGVSRSVISKWERAGLERAELGCLVRVARVLEVHVEDLFESD